MVYIIKGTEITLIVVLILNDCKSDARNQSSRKADLNLEYDYKLSVSSKEKKHKSKPDIQTILEEKYKFRNDETSTRFRIARDESSDPGVYSFFIKEADKIMLKGERVKMYGTWDHPPIAIRYTSNAQTAWFRAFAARRIVGGMETSINVYPYNVAISRNGKHWCGGSVIDEQWVLTAGHCLESAIDGDKRKLQNFIVRAGSSFHNRGGYQARVNKVFFREEYAPGNADYDFSLLRLDRPMPIGRNIAVLNLPAKEYALREDDILIVTGWGSTDASGYGHIPDRVRFVPVPVMDLEDCQKSYRFYITKRMLCAGYATGGKDACNHDSGGPAVRDGVLLGIVSFGGKQCGDPRSPGVYSRVSEITDWVESTITSNEAYLVPELQAKIEKARKRERELQKFKSRVEDKKNKIKNWLRETLKSPNFIQLAKRKLKEAGFNMGDEETRRLQRVASLDEKNIDEANLFNMINERVLEADGKKNEAETLLRTLALQEVINGNSREEIYTKVNGSEENFENIMSYLSI